MQEFQVFDREPRGEVCRCLNGPLERGASTHEAFGDGTRTVKIDQEVVVYDPEHLQVVSTTKIDGLLDKLLGRQRIPFASIDAGVCTITAVIGASEAGGIHGPTLSANAFIGIEVRKMIGLGRHVDEW